MKLRYLIETNDYNCYASCLCDIAESLNIPLYTLKHRIKTKQMDIEKVTTTLAKLLSDYKDTIMDKYGVLHVPKTEQREDKNDLNECQQEND